MFRDCSHLVVLIHSIFFAFPLSCAQQAEPPQGASDAESAPRQTETAIRRIADRIHRGIDVSHFSGQVDWQEVAGEGHGFAVAKATEGTDLKDPTFDSHWPAMKAAGLVRGAYHFFVTHDDPEVQARFFIDNVQLEPGDLAPVVDIESIGAGTKPGLPQRLRTFLSIIENHYGVKPIIYTSTNFWDRHLSDEFGEYPLWVAEFEVETPRLPKGWSTWHLWQWKGDTRVAGIEKDVDLSRANSEETDRSILVIP